MTSRNLYDKLKNYENRTYTATLGDNGLEFNTSDIFSRLIKDAARCNSYSSDVFYDLKTIEDAMRNYNPENDFMPIWIAFRKLGVDGTSYVLSRIHEQGDVYDALYQNYFALYSFNVEKRDNGLYSVLFREYPV